MRHEPTVLERFLNGETRLVYGRQPSGELWLLPDGEAAQHRAWVKAKVTCPIDDCPAPSLTTVARHPNKRDGFMHVMDGAGNHSPESLFHIQGKARVADWLRNRYPNSTVTLEQQSDAARTRVADVMLTSPDGSIRVAFEIQYAGLTPAAWRARHDSYRSQGVVDVWLWGHHGAQMRVSRRDPNVAELNPTQRALVAEGMPLLWINPIEGTVGTATQTVKTGMWSERPDVEIFATQSGVFEAFPLDDCGANRDGIWSHRIRELLDGPSRVKTAEAEGDARRTAALAAGEAARLAFEAAEVDRRKRVREQNLNRRKAAEATWLRSTKRAAWVQHYFGGALPEWLGFPVDADIWVPADQWQMVVHREFLGRQRGIYRGGFTVEFVANRLRREFRGAAGTTDALTRGITEWLTHLVAANVLTIPRTPIRQSGFRSDGPRYYLTGDEPQPAPERVPTMRVDNPGRDEQPLCHGCGGPVDKLLPSGYHLMCDPNRRR